MSLSVEIDIPGLNEHSALALDRKANTSGAPFVAPVRRSGSRFERRRSWVIDFVDLHDDPSVGSETLDHPDGWPRDKAVRVWLANAMRFLAAEVPERRFSFQAGWPEQLSSATADVSSDQFVELICSGDLKAGTRYVVEADAIAG